MSYLCMDSPSKYNAATRIASLDIIIRIMYPHYRSWLNIWKFYRKSPALTTVFFQKCVYSKRVCTPIIIFLYYVRIA